MNSRQEVFTFYCGHGLAMMSFGDKVLMAAALVMENSVSVTSSSSLHLSFSSSSVESLSETSDPGLHEEQASTTVEPYLFETSEEVNNSEAIVDSDESAT